MRISDWSSDVCSSDLDLICRSKVGAVADKGAGKPVLMQYERELIDAENGVPVATIEEVYVLRGAGGYGGVNQPVSAPMQPVPDRMADAVLDLPTFAQQAMLYRLNGDRKSTRLNYRHYCADSMPTYA